MKDHIDDIKLAASITAIVIVATTATFVVNGNSPGSGVSGYFLFLIWLGACVIAMVPTHWYAKKHIE